jgi:hypothetical protein
MKHRRLETQRDSREKKVTHKNLFDTTPFDNLRQKLAVALNPPKPIMQAETF